MYRDKRMIEFGEFEFETYLTKDELMKFLRNLADQIERGNEIDIPSEDWIIRFSFTEPIEVEVEFDADAKKLEFEIEFRQRSKITTGLKDFVLKRRSKDGGFAFCNPLPSSLSETFYAVYILDAINVEIEDKEMLVEFLLDKIYSNVHSTFYVYNTR